MRHRFLGIARQASVSLGVLLAFASFARAQDTAHQLPGMIISSEGGPGALHGVVLDDRKFPLAGADVYIPELQLKTVTKEDGTYRFAKLPRGTHEVYARKIGYRAQGKKVKLQKEGTVQDFELGNAPRALPAVVSSSTRGGLSGVVADTAFRAMDSVFVRVAGEGMHAYTAIDGEFFFPLKPGHYLVSLSKKGFAPRVVSVTIPDDSGRRVQAFMQPTKGVVSPWVMIEMTQRLAWRNLNTSRVYTREDLQKLKVDWVYQAVLMVSAHFDMHEVPSMHCEATIDGIWRSEVANLMVDDIDSIELYSSGGGKCPITFVWLR